MGRFGLLGWVQLVLGSHAWGEIVFSTLNPRLLPEGCSCASDYYMKVKPICLCENSRFDGFGT